MPKDHIHIHGNSSSDFRVLIVEDQSSDIIGPYMLIHHLGFDVTIAFDGNQALDQIKKSTFDLVLLDWNMPIASGQDLLNQIEDDRININSQLPIRIILHSGESLNHYNFNTSKRFEIIDIWKKPICISEISRKLRGLSDK